MEILFLFKEPYVLLAEARNAETEVSDPWNFDQLLVNRGDYDMSMDGSHEIRRSDAMVKGLELSNEPSLPDLGRLSLEKKLQVDAQRKQTETDGDMVFSTADTSAQGTVRDPRHNDNLQMASQSSISGLEESKSARGGNLSGRDRLDPRIIPSEYPPHELGRPSLSESTGPPSKNFSPQFDKISSHTKDN